MCLVAYDQEQTIETEMGVELKSLTHPHLSPCTEGIRTDGENAIK